MEIPHIVITKDIVILIVFYILGLAVALTKLLDTFQSWGWIKPGDENTPGTTGYWNQVLSFVITAASFAAVHLGAGAGVDSVIQAGVEASAVLLASGLLAMLAWFAHQGVLIIDGLKKQEPKEPKALTPIAVAAEVSVSPKGESVLPAGLVPQGPAG